MIGNSAPLGQIGLVPDLGKAHRLPVGAWLDGNNIRFNENHMRPVGEPELVLATEEPGKWLQIYNDDLGPRLVYASDSKLYRLNISQTAWEDVTRLSGPYSPGEWHSFPWGESVIFNNGIDVPQILLPGAANFVDLPNWGLLTSGQSLVSAKSLRPFGVFLVAINITIDGVVKPNMVWWSSPAVIDNNDSALYSPSWDYESTTELAGFNYVGVSDGDLIDSLTMDTSHMIYAQAATYAMQLAGGTRVFAFRRALEYGLANLGAVVEYNNFHYVVGPATVYTHDGSTVRQVADERVEDTFLDLVSEAKDLKCFQNQTTKEINTLFIDKTSGYKRYLIYNYEEDVFTFADGFDGNPADGSFVQSMSYGLKLDPGGGGWDSQTDTWETISGSWQSKDPASDVRTLYWLTDDELMLAEQQPDVRGPFKRYFAKSGYLAWKDMAPQFNNTNNVNELLEILPHVEGSAQTQFRLSCAANQGGAVTQKQTVTFDPVTDYKADVRLSGRYILMEVEITGNGEWEMYSMDYEVLQSYGR